MTPQEPQLLAAVSHELVPMAEAVIRVNELLRDYETAQEADAAARQDGSWTVPMVERNDRRLVILGDLNDEPHAVPSEMVAGPSDASISHPDKLDDVRLYSLADEIPERV